MRYQNKVTIITGGSMGIGEGCVRAFVREGSKVVFCAPGENDGNDLVKELNDAGPGEAAYVKCDVSKEEEIKNLISVAVDKYGRIDCLINNAGIHPSPKPIDGFSVEEFKAMLDVNLVGYFLTAKYALPHLRKTKGNIINVSSLVNKIGKCAGVIYVTTKGGIAAMTRALAVDEARYEVRVNAISPGNVWTPMWDNIASSGENPEALRKKGADAQLLGRFGTIKEAGDLCMFLAAEATFCTGLDINLSGGAELNYGTKTMTNPGAGGSGAW